MRDPRDPGGDDRTNVTDAWAHGATDATDRPAVARLGLRSLAGAAAPLARFRPPFEFGDFFAPEDTLLCALATAWALERTAQETGAPPSRLIELTCGGGMVALGPLDRWPTLRAWGADVDPAAVARARRNATALGLADRARFVRLGLFDRRLAPWLQRRAPDLVACNPPYVPEPPDAPGALVAGAGPDGARHPRRTIAVCARARVRRFVLSWCSLGDPVGVARAAARRGYALEALWAAAIPDGEYTGGVYDYMRTLPTAWLDDSPATRAALAPDGSARFGYLLLAGSFVRSDEPAAGVTGPARAGVRLVARLVRRFARRGLPGMATLARRADAGEERGPPLHAYAADRWDEIALRAIAHGRAAP
jgi:methylase of polypeptide subunit release factors